MKARVPQNIKAFQKTFERMLETIAEIKFSQNKMGLPGTFKDNFRLTVNNNLPISQMLKSITNEKAVSLIMSMNFSLVKALDNYPFVCSDAPVSYYCKNYNSGRGVGLSTPDIEIFLPLDKSFGLICTRKNIPAYKDLSKDEVAQLNRRTVITAEKYIFSSIKESYIKELIEKNKNCFSGIRYLESSLKDGLFQYVAYIPVTD